MSTQSNFARGDLAQHTLQLARLAREDQRRKARELTLDLGQRCLVGIIWYLLDRFASPTGGRPAFHGQHVLSLLGGRPKPLRIQKCLIQRFLKMEHGNGYATLVERSAVWAVRASDLAHKPRGACGHEIKNAGCAAIS